MKLLTLHRRVAYIQYKHTLCSWPALFVLFCIIVTVLLPFYIASWLFNDIWSQYKIIYEHPDIQFQYKYIFVAEYEPMSSETDDVLVSGTSIACTSYQLFSDLFDNQLDCSTITFWETDSDFDQRNDHMTMQFELHSPTGYMLKQFDLYMGFHAELNHQCHLQIPAAVVLRQIQAPNNFAGGEIMIESELKLTQRVGFYCPFFLRQIKSHFYQTPIDENSTIVRDYEMSSIRKKLQNNPAYISNDQTTPIYWNDEPTNKIILNIDLKIDETVTRYHTSFWQRLGQIWIHYFSIFLVCAYLMEKIKHYVFSKQIIRAWEMIPWKKIY